MARVAHVNVMGIIGTFWDIPNFFSRPQRGEILTSELKADLDGDVKLLASPLGNAPALQDHVQPVHVTD
jgi:hypothetical protein